MIDQKIQPMGIQDFFELANGIACIRAPDRFIDQNSPQIAQKSR
jgi:hypothetical protein